MRMRHLIIEASLVGDLHEIYKGQPWIMPQVQDLAQQSKRYATTRDHGLVKLGISKASSRSLGITHSSFAGVRRPLRMGSLSMVDGYNSAINQRSFAAPHMRT